MPEKLTISPGCSKRQSLLPPPLVDLGGVVCVCGGFCTEGKEEYKLKVIHFPYTKKYSIQQVLKVCTNVCTGFPHYTVR